MVTFNNKNKKKENTSDWLVGEARYLSLSRREVAILSILIYIINKNTMLRKVHIYHYLLRNVGNNPPR